MGNAMTILTWALAYAPPEGGRPPSTVPPPPSSIRSPPPPSSGGCQSSGPLVFGGVSYPEQSCSPPIASSTSIILTDNDFSQGGDGGAPSESDNMYHQNSKLMIDRVAKEVVDECDSINGCDAKHFYQPPRQNNIVDGSDAVWSALGLDNIRKGAKKT
ncbi:kiwellin-like [Rhodamnia argentea]|uniref:Kiwellin-like n=1 Tax=Rhodamnia argentea TaxID=178133 RepID=A0ABM3HB18_9MYRT|nr:kiwellin-like [Rhodamnia argentea]